MTGPVPIERWAERRESWNSQPEDARNSADIDYARVVHSASFRRLQGKTQILNLGDSDFYRTRLTHSLEVAQIASGIVRQFERHESDHPAYEYLPNSSQIQAIALTHDLGHPPFGHGGEVALNFCMHEHGGFEGNGQTLRTLSKLEKFSANAGSNLNRRTLLGVLKYPAPYSAVFRKDKTPKLHENPQTIRIINRKLSKPPKCYLDTEKDVVDWILEPLSPSDAKLFETLKEKEGEHAKPIHKSFDCSIMDVADDIAYGVHDLEDSIAMRLVTEEQFRESVREEHAASMLDSLKEKYPAESGNNVYESLVRGLFGEGATRKRFIGRMVHHLITNIYIDTIGDFEEPLLKFRAKVRTPARAFLDKLQECVVDHVIKSAGVQHLEFKGQSMVVAVFDVLMSEPGRFLPTDTRRLFEASSDGRRVVCDHIAGMTDAFLLRTYERLFSPRMGSVFDKL